MKLTFAIILIGCLHVSAGVHSQSKVTLNMHSADIKKVLTAIEKRPAFVSYDSNLLAEQPKVTISANNEDVLSVVNRLLANTLIAYEVLNNNLVVLKEENSIITQTAVKGRITNAAGEPLAAVSIRVKGSNAGTSTDADGRYSIEVPNDAVLVISSICYLTQEIAVNGRTEINIVLQPNNTQLEQVVVIGYGTAQKRDITGSIAKVSGRKWRTNPILNPLLLTGQVFRGEYHQYWFARTGAGYPHPRNHQPLSNQASLRSGWIVQRQYQFPQPCRYRIHRDPERSFLARHLRCSWRQRCDHRYHQKRKNRATDHRVEEIDIVIERQSIPAYVERGAWFSG